MKTWMNISLILIGAALWVGVTSFARTTPKVEAQKPKADSSVMYASKDTTIISTEKLGADIKGYRATTPLKVYLVKNTIVKVEAMRNNETPKYFKMVRANLLNKWVGIKVANVAKTQVDAISGATLSSNAVNENIKRAVEYSQSHRLN